MIEVAQADIWQKRACVMTIPLPNTYQLVRNKKKSTLKKFLDFCGTLKKIEMKFSSLWTQITKMLICHL